MPEKRSKYDTDPLDPDFVRRTEEMSGQTSGVGGEQQTVPLGREAGLEEPTRRFDEQLSDSYPSVFVPPAYQAPPRPQPFTTFGVGAEPHQPPAAAVPPGPSSPYSPQPPGADRSRKVAKLGLAENVAIALPYTPFYIGLVIGLIWMLVVPRHETRTRFHAAQGLAVQLAILAGSFAFGVISGITGSGIGGGLFWIASTIFLLVSMKRVWQGKPHHIAPLDDVIAWLDDHLKPMK
ncbi:MAG TPA: hypothetical protein VG148_00025 [Pyrinomonadaceae bacterium]|nr:hypothetical protein [Pyrinomonadaceae bacterium]